MEEMNFLKLRNMLNRYGVIMSFTGPFSQGIIEEIGLALRGYLESRNDSKGQIFKVFSVFIEQTQNIKNYAYNLADKHEQEEVMLSGVLNIGLRDGKYFVSSGNIVKKEDVEELNNRLEKINSYTKKELAKVYREELLKSDKLKEGQGAGLGLIEMARKAEDKLIFNFEEIDEKYSFYTLIIKI